MEPITSKQQLFMTFPVEDEDYDIFYLKNTPPEKIGSLPSSIDHDSIAEVLSFLELVHSRGVDVGKNIGGKDVIAQFEGTCKSARTVYR